MPRQRQGGASGSARPEPLLLAFGGGGGSGIKSLYDKGDGCVGHHLLWACRAGHGKILRGDGADHLNLAGKSTQPRDVVLGRARRTLNDIQVGGGIGRICRDGESLNVKKKRV